MSNRKKKKRRGIIYFAPPVMVIVIGIIVYLIVLPSYGQGSIKICDLLMLNPRDMINTILGVEIIQTANSVAIDKIRVLDWIFIITFIVSLYFPGFYLHFRTSVPNENASVEKKDACLLIQKANIVLKGIKRQRKGKELDNLLYDAKCLEEKLAVESDFGYGDNRVIECEESIEKELQIFLNGVSAIETGNYKKNVQELEKIVVDINALLKQRNELKKR